VGKVRTTFGSRGRDTEWIIQAKLILTSDADRSLRPVTISIVSCVEPARNRLRRNNELDDDICSYFALTDSDLDTGQRHANAPSALVYRRHFIPQRFSINVMEKESEYASLHDISKRKCPIMISSYGSLVLTASRIMDNRDSARIVRTRENKIRRNTPERNAKRLEKWILLAHRTLPEHEASRAISARRDAPILYSVHTRERYVYMCGNDRFGSR